MGVVTGATIGLLSFQMVMKQLKKSNSKMNISNELKIEQNIKGRLRAYCEKLKEQTIGDALQIQLVRIDGINKVSVNNITGSILVQYDYDKVDQGLLVPALMKLLGLDLEANGDRKSVVMNEARLVNKAVNSALIDKTQGLLDLDTIIPLTFIGMAVREIARTGTLSSPPPLTLLNWAYLGLLFRGDK